MPKPQSHQQCINDCVYSDDNPRPACHGQLCHRCYYTTSRNLTNLPSIYDWLGQRMPRALTTPATDQRVTTTRNPPSPIRLDHHDHRQLIRQTLTWWAARVTRNRQLRPPRTLEVNQLASLLLTHLDWTAEQPWAPTLLQDTNHLVSRAQQIDPWQRHRTDSPAPCPECRQTTLSKYGGEDHIICRNCNEIIPEKMYEFYVKVLATGNCDEDLHP